MFKRACVSSLSLFLFLAYFCLHAKGWSGNGDWGAGPLFPKDKRETIVSTEYGEISAAQVSDGTRRGSYHLQFFTLEPNSLFLPVLLHTDMVFYVHTGSGKLNWANEEKEKTTLTELRRGDVYRLKPGTVFYLQSNLESEREKLRIYAIFVNLEDGDVNEVSSIGAYSSISDLVRGFDKKVLQAAFEVSEELIEAITNATKPPAIVHNVPARSENLWGWEARFLKAFIGSQGHSIYDLENKKKAAKTFNIRDADPDFENCNGRALTVTTKDMKVLKGSNIGIFMVNLTKGSMMGPHWNPLATEIAVVLEGQGIVRVVCSSNTTKSSSSNTTKSSSSNSTKFKCENRSFRVREGDVFVVPRFHPMAQMSFNNGSLVFMGFSTASKLNHPQFLAGESSVLRTLDRDVLAAAFNVSNTTMDQFLTPQRESIILDCTSCAEEEARMMEEEIEKKRQEEEARKEEEERKRKEEEAKEEEEEKKREEEEARKKEEEEARKREEEKKREEEEAEARKREEEEAKEEDRRREAAAEREQEEAMREEDERQKREREEEKYEKEKKREEEEAKARKREEEETKREEDRRREAAAEREQEEAMKGEEERQKREGEEVKYEIGGGGEGKRAEY
ncbi:vicilin-like seed storage protein At2g18540 [Vitis riparia]|uniref:vicilin-like seed storage protein At2g18540 n=1 Tax=Vitis riparia TaxID=96939 RepID=UPI00155B0827|nr:vicilin-like seed storage protein At2g18540 [Vitis riparia]